MVPLVPDASPAITGTGNKRRRTSVPIRRQESAFMYSPEEQGTAGIPGYMPFTSHRFKRIDVYLWYSNLAKNAAPVDIEYKKELSAGNNGYYKHQEAL